MSNNINGPEEVPAPPKAPSPPYQQPKKKKNTLLIILLVVGGLLLLGLAGCVGLGVWIYNAAEESGDYLEEVDDDMEAISTEWDNLVENESEYNFNFSNKFISEMDFDTMETSIKDSLKYTDELEKKTKEMKESLEVPKGTMSEGEIKVMNEKLAILADKILELTTKNKLILANQLAFIEVERMYKEWYHNVQDVNITASGLEKQQKKLDSAIKKAEGIEMGSAFSQYRDYFIEMLKGEKKTFDYLIKYMNSGNNSDYENMEKTENEAMDKFNTSVTEWNEEYMKGIDKLNEEIDDAFDEANDARSKVI